MKVFSSVSLLRAVVFQKTIHESNHHRPTLINAIQLGLESYPRGHHPRGVESTRATPYARRRTPPHHRTRNEREIKRTSASAHPLAHRTTPRATPSRGFAPTRRTARPLLLRADAPGRRFTTVRDDATRVAEIVTLADISIRRIFLQRIQLAGPGVLPRAFRCASIRRLPTWCREKTAAAARILLKWNEFGWDAGSPFRSSLCLCTTKKTFVRSFVLFSLARSSSSLSSTDARSTLNERLE